MIRMLSAEPGTVRPIILHTCGYPLPAPIDEYIPIKLVKNDKRHEIYSLIREPNTSCFAII